MLIQVVVQQREMASNRIRPGAWSGPSTVSFRRFVQVFCDSRLTYSGGKCWVKAAGAPSGRDSIALSDAALMLEYT